MPYSAQCSIFGNFISKVSATLESGTIEYLFPALGGIWFMEKMFYYTKFALVELFLRFSYIRKSPTIHKLKAKSKWKPLVVETK